MKIYILLFFTLICSITWAEKEIFLTLGGTHHLPLSPSVWIENKQILTASVGGSNILIKGQHEGSSLVRLGSSIYAFHVLHPANNSTLNILKVLLKKIIGLKVQKRNSHVIVSGTLFRLRDWITIANALGIFHSRYQFQPEMSEALKAESQIYFNRLLKNKNLLPVNLIYGNQITVYCPFKNLIHKYESLLNPYGIQVEYDESSVKTAPDVKVEIAIAEVKKDFNRKIGIQPPTSYSAKVIPNGSNGLDSLVFSIKAFEHEGLGRILANPNIIARSGKEASLMAGGEFPIKIINFSSHDVIWKKYGILLKIKPLADLSGRISLSIETEVSSIDPSRSVDGIPALFTNRVSSHFDLNQSKIIALSGLIKSESSQSSEGLPFLSQIPILGALFSSKDFQENRTELVIFVKPSIFNEDAPLE